MYRHIAASDEDPGLSTSKMVEPVSYSSAIFTLVDDQEVVCQERRGKFFMFEFASQGISKFVGSLLRFRRSWLERVEVPKS